MYPMEGFYVNYASIDQNISYSPKCNYDLLLACERQRNFYYQVLCEVELNGENEQQVHTINHGNLLVLIEDVLHRSSDLRIYV